MTVEMEVVVVNGDSGVLNCTGAQLMLWFFSLSIILSQLFVVNKWLNVFLNILDHIGIQQF